MIEGLKVTIGGEELRKLCYQRSAHCDAQADKAGAQAQEIEDLGSTGYTNGDPARALKDLQERYRRQAREMTFIGDHIKTSEEYLLTDQDLNKLGITRSQWE